MSHLYRSQQAGGGKAVVLIQTSGKLSLSPRDGETASPLTHAGSNKLLSAEPPGLPRARGLAALPSGKLNPSPMTSPPLPGGTTLSQAQGPRVTSFLPSRSNSGLP